METNLWLPITEYAMRRGISVSTLRRRIKTNDIEFRMEDGRYLIKCDLPELNEGSAFTSSDAPQLTLSELEAMLQRTNEQNALHWRAIEARVTGLSKKVEMFSEQVSELKMLVKIFEEKLDAKN